MASRMRGRPDMVQMKSEEGYTIYRLRTPVYDDTGHLCEYVEPTEEEEKKWMQSLFSPDDML